MIRFALAVGMVAAGFSAHGADTIEWIHTYEEALEKARETGKPILLNIRCAPCINARQFDAKLVMTPVGSPRGELMDKYVCARVTSNSGMDIALYDRDWHNSIYLFLINADETIYARYGGRDAEDAHTYLDLDSFALALEAGLEQHEKYKQGELPPQPKPEPRYPNEIELLDKHVISMNRCVECHLIEDYRTQELELAGQLDKRTTLFRSPDIKRIGIHLDVPKGLLVGKAEGAVADAGMRPGDTVAAINGTPVLTFGDLQHAYNKTSRDAETITLTVERDGAPVALNVALPPDWWVTDPSFRYLTIDPMVDFDVRKLTAEEKEEHGFPEDGFACEVTDVGQRAALLGIHNLEVGDIVYAVNGDESGEFTQNVMVHLKLTVTAGDSAMLGVLRDGETLEMEINTHRQYFRKAKE